jgi:hypothetical protein
LLGFFVELLPDRVFDREQKTLFGQCRSTFNRKHHDYELPGSTGETPGIHLERHSHCPANTTCMHTLDRLPIIASDRLPMRMGAFWNKILAIDE